MCGIIACIGKNVTKMLIEGLERLEYRGYDSAGMTVLTNGEFFTKKALGNVKELKKLVANDSLDGLGIAHTRWATHGNISLENAHPHFSQGGNLALVHNGIIENYQNIKSNLDNSGAQFYGQSDSEVVAKFFGEQIDEKLLHKKLQSIEGSYAFAIICKGQERIYFAKNKSPLYVFEGRMIASDPSVFAPYGKEFIALDDGEYGYIDGKEAKIFKNGALIQKDTKLIDFEFVQEGKAHYDHFMIKEIYDSKKVIKGLKSHYTQNSVQKQVKSMNFERFNRIYFIACGTAYHAGLMAGAQFRKYFDKDVYIEKAGEICYKNLPIDENSLCFFISQSGETADSWSALEYVRAHNGVCACVVNTIYSTLSQKCDFVFPICAGQEKAVASTKAYFGQVLALLIIAHILKGEDFEKLLDEFEETLDYGNDEEIKRVARHLAKREKLFFIGRGEDYISALEASLKMKEISYIFSCGESAAELKHGSLALIENGVDAVLVATNLATLSKNLASAEEVHARGGKVIFVSPFSNADGKIDFYISVKPCKEEFMPLQTMLVLQKLSYFVAIMKGNNPDQPRNLAKSVTVE